MPTFEIRTQDGDESTVQADTILPTFDDVVRLMNNDGEVVAVTPIRNLSWVRRIEDPEPEPKQTICGVAFGQNKDICTRLPGHPHWQDDGIGHSVISVVEDIDAHQ